MAPQLTLCRGCAHWFTPDYDMLEFCPECNAAPVWERMTPEEKRQEQAVYLMGEAGMKGKDL